MSAEAVNWALKQNISGPKNLLLVALAWMADDNGVTYKGQKKIAAKMDRDPRWIREHLPGLAEAGLVTRVRRHRMNGSRTSDLTILNYPRTEPIDLSEYDGIVGEIEPGDREPVVEISPQGLAVDSGSTTGENPPGHTKNKGEEQESHGNAHASARDDDPIPEDFPDELRPHARIVLVKLREIAAAHNAKAVKSMALANVMMARPHHPFVKAVFDLAAWSQSSRRIKDVVSTYRSWLDRCDELAGVERLPGSGLPDTSNVRPFRRGGSNADKVDEALGALEAAEQAGAPE